MGCNCRLCRRSRLSGRRFGRAKVAGICNVIFVSQFNIADLIRCIPKEVSNILTMLGKPIIKIIAMIMDSAVVNRLIAVLGF